jgi:predicted ATP-binding protein involved in virulence
MEVAKVKKINITNFKGIQTLELDFTYSNNHKILDNIVIYGINGSGKSTILEAIYICLIVASVHHNKKDLPRIEAYLISYLSLGSEWIYNNEEEFIIEIEFFDHDTLIKAKLTYHKIDGLTWRIQNNQKLSENFQKSFSYLSSYRLLNPSTVHSAGNWGEIERIEEELLRRRRRYPPRDIRYRKDNSFPSLSLQFENNYGTVKQYLVNLVTDKSLEAISDENNAILDKIKQSFKIFFPNKKFLEKLSRASDMQDYRLMIQNEDNSIVDLDQLSSGEREVIAFFTYLCTKAIHTSILIIDEPELHLHAKWQSIILYAIHKVFPDVQLFLATHSEEIHQSVSESELFELVK